MFVFLMLVVQFLGGIALDYTDLEAMGVACKGRDSCRSMKEPNDFSKRNCECDAPCRTYGDCCVDAPSVIQDGNDNLQRVCMPFGTTANLGAYVISGCPLRGEVSSATAACSENDLSDPLVTAPVSTPDGTTYRNAYCADCNGAELENLVTWQPLVNCETLASYNLSADFVWGGLERASDRDDEWGVWFNKQFHRCDLLFDKPDSVKAVRLCRASVVATCPDTYRRKTVRRHCEAYTAVVYTEEGTYRNPHCAVCNGVAVDKLVCDSSELLSRNTNRFSMAHLFDVNRSDGDCVGVTNCCSKDQVFDPYNKKCRNLVCGVPGMKMENKKCVKT